MIPFCRIFVHFLWWIGTLVVFFEVEIHEDLTRFWCSRTLQLKGCLLLCEAPSVAVFLGDLGDGLGAGFQFGVLGFS